MLRILLAAALLMFFSVSALSEEQSDSLRRAELAARADSLKTAADDLKDEIKDMKRTHETAMRNMCMTSMQVREERSDGAQAADSIHGVMDQRAIWIEQEVEARKHTIDSLKTARAAVQREIKALDAAIKARKAK